MQFEIKLNDMTWNIVFVDPESKALYHDGEQMVGITKYYEQSIYISNKLPQDIFMRIYLHEITHALMFSYLLVVPNKFTDEEVCNFVAQYLNDMIKTRDAVIMFLSENGVAHGF